MFKRAINRYGKIVRIDDYPTREAAHADKPFTDTNHIGLKLTPVIIDEKNVTSRLSDIHSGKLCRNVFGETEKWRLGETDTWRQAPL